MTIQDAMTDVELVHIGGQRKTVHIHGFTETTLMFSWPLCGVYEIRVKTNKIVRMPSWRALDHEKIRELHRTLLSGRNEKYKQARYGT